MVAKKGEFEKKQTPAGVELVAFLPQSDICRLAHLLDFLGKEHKKSPDNDVTREMCSNVADTFNALQDLMKMTKKPFRAVIEIQIGT